MHRVNLAGTARRALPKAPMVALRRDWEALAAVELHLQVPHRPSGRRLQTLLQPDGARPVGPLEGRLRLPLPRQRRPARERAVVRGRVHARVRVHERLERGAALRKRHGRRRPLARPRRLPRVTSRAGALLHQASAV